MIIQLALDQGNGRETAYNLSRVCPRFQETVQFLMSRKFRMVSGLSLSNSQTIYDDDLVYRRKLTLNKWNVNIHNQFFQCLNRNSLLEEIVFNINEYADSFIEPRFSVNINQPILLTRIKTIRILINHCAIKTMADIYVNVIRHLNTPNLTNVFIQNMFDPPSEWLRDFLFSNIDSIQNLNLVTRNNQEIINFIKGSTKLKQLQLCVNDANELDFSLGKSQYEHLNINFGVNFYTEPLLFPSFLRPALLTNYDKITRLEVTNCSISYPDVQLMKRMNQLQHLGLNHVLLTNPTYIFKYLIRNLGLNSLTILCYHFRFDESIYHLLKNYTSPTLRSLSLFHGTAMPLYAVNHDLNLNSMLQSLIEFLIVKDYSMFDQILAINFY